MRIACAFVVDRVEPLARGSAPRREGGIVEAHVGCLAFAVFALDLRGACGFFGCGSPSIRSIEVSPPADEIIDARPIAGRIGELDAAAATLVGTDLDAVGISR